MTREFRWRLLLCIIAVLLAVPVVVKVAEDAYWRGMDTSAGPGGDLVSCEGIVVRFDGDTDGGLATVRLDEDARKAFGGRAYARFEMGSDDLSRAGVETLRTGDCVAVDYVLDEADLGRETVSCMGLRVAAPDGTIPERTGGPTGPAAPLPEVPEGEWAVPR